ncbi:hypothetical protein Z043_119446 [Scleropages formosus]|uniref:Uncharacterized protein n=1 Tax=Scleropages formosus TaxID=113540 RepID=A0A0P7TMS4_SCLFO|nr:hypothetical protein Z043_119446 [Scleropages formosus]
MDSGGRLTTGGRPQDGHLGSSCVCDNVSLTPPAGVDPHVFRDLPADIQKELLSSSTVDTVLRCPSSAGPSDSEPGFVTGLHLSSSECLQQRHPVELHTESRSPVCDVPPHIDPQVFAELPPELQRELLSEWTRKTSAVKMQPPARHGRPAASRGSKLATASSSQTNNLLREVIKWPLKSCSHRTTADEQTGSSVWGPKGTGLGETPFLLDLVSQPMTALLRSNSVRALQDVERVAEQPWNLYPIAEPRPVKHECYPLYCPGIHVPQSRPESSQQPQLDNTSAEGLPMSHTLQPKEGRGPRLSGWMQRPAWLSTALSSRGLQGRKQTAASP